MITMLDLLPDGGIAPWPWPVSPPPQAHAEFEEEDDNGSPILFRHFDSVADYVALKPHQVNQRNSWSRGTETKGRDWFGCSGGLAEAERICAAGSWPEGQRRMEEELNAFDVPTPRSIKRKGIWADQGDALDIHRVYSGQLDSAWRRTVRHPRPASQSLVIAVPMMITAQESSEKLFWCGAAALKLCDVLTKAGYNVSLIGTQGTYHAGRTAYDSVYIKHSHEPLDVAALVVSVAFPGFARTVGFRATVSLPFDVGIYLGTVPSDEDKPLTKLGLPASGIIGGLYHAVSSRESAQRWIAQQLALLNTVHLEAS